VRTREVRRAPRPRPSRPWSLLEALTQSGTAPVRSVNATSSDPHDGPGDGSVPLDASTPLSVPQTLSSYAADCVTGSYRGIRACPCRVILTSRAEEVEARATGAHGARRGSGRTGAAVAPWPTHGAAREQSAGWTTGDRARSQRPQASPDPHGGPEDGSVASPQALSRDAADCPTGG